MGATIRFCSICASTRAFEPVPCADGHGTDCPEALCIECGYVVVVGVLAEEARPSAAARAVA